MLKNTPKIKLIQQIGIFTFQVILICFPFFSFGQKMDFRQIDSTTYHLYNTGQWDPLISAGKSALDNGVDYFYLRVRLGMAYYNKEKFRKASHELEEAMKFNSTDTFALKYLYKSYWFGGQKADARSVSAQFNSSLDKQLGISRSNIIAGFFAEGGYNFSNVEKKAAIIDFDGNENVYGEALLPGNLSYITFGLKHQISNSVSIIHAYTNLNLQMMQYIKVVNINIPHTSNLVQNQYYFQSLINLKRKITVVPAFHYIGTNYTLLNSTYDSVSDRYFFSQLTTKLNNYVIFLSLYKNYSYLAGSLSGSWSNLNEKTQTQLNLNISVFPFANLKFYTSTTISSLSEKGKMALQVQRGRGSSRGIGKSRLIIDQMIGGKLFNNIYLEGSFTWGDMSNFNEKNAYYVYNIPDQIKYRVGASLIFELKPNIDFSLNFQYLQKNGSYVRYQNLTNFTTENFIYQNKTITGGLKWKL